MENNVREESGLKFQFPENETVIQNSIETILINCRMQRV